MYDAKAHIRIDEIERRLDQHMKHIDKLSKAIELHTASLEENTRLTRNISENTAEMVELFKSAKLFRKFLVWITPIGAAVYAIWHSVWGKG